MDIKNRILQSLRPRRDGILLRSDVRTFGSPSQISFALNHLIEQGLVERLDRGIYAKPSKVMQMGKQALLDQALMRIQSAAQLSRPQQARTSPTAQYVRKLARAQGIAFMPTFADRWASTVTKLSDDEVKSDATDDLLVALTRSGKLSPSNMLKLVFAHHRELKRV